MSVCLIDGTPLHPKLEKNLVYCIVRKNKGNTMNPMYKRMLKDFMNHLERRDSRSGWSIVSKPSYETTNIRKSYPKQRPEGSMRQTFKVFSEWMEMGEKDLNHEIDTFLKTYEV